MGKRGRKAIVEGERAITVGSTVSAQQFKQLLEVAKDRKTNLSEAIRYILDKFLMTEWQR